MRWKIIMWLKTHYFNCWPWLVSLYGTPSNMINNTYKDWFCVDTSVQNDIYRLSGPIVGTWAPLSAQNNLERTWTGLICLQPEKMPQNGYIFWWPREEGGNCRWFFCRNQTVFQCSWVISFRGQKFSFLWSAHFPDNCLPAQMAPVITPASPFPKIDHLIETKFLVIAGTKISTCHLNFIPWKSVWLKCVWP